MRSHWVSKSNVSVREVNVSISGRSVTGFRQQQVIIRRSASDPVSENDIDRLSELASGGPTLHGEQIVQLLPIEYSIDSKGEVRDPVGKKRRDTRSRPSDFNRPLKRYQKYIEVP